MNESKVHFTIIKVNDHWISKLMNEIKIHFEVNDHQLSKLMYEIKVNFKVFKVNYHWI